MKAKDARIFWLVEDGKIKDVYLRDDALRMFGRIDECEWARKALALLIEPD